MRRYCPTAFPYRFPMGKPEENLRTPKRVNAGQSGAQGEEDPTSGLFRSIPRTPTGHPRATNRHHEIRETPKSWSFRGTAKQDEMGRARLLCLALDSRFSTRKTDYSCSACACNSPGRLVEFLLAPTLVARLIRGFLFAQFGDVRAAFCFCYTALIYVSLGSFLWIKGVLRRLLLSVD